MFERRERWAARWTWGVFTMNIHSTQRIEAVHGAVSNILGANMLLTVLLPKLEALIGDAVAHGIARDVAVAVLINLVTSSRFDSPRLDVIKPGTQAER